MHGWLFCNDTYRFFSLPTLGKDAVTKTDNKYIAHFLFLSYMSLYYGPMNIIRHLMISILSAVLRWRIFLYTVSSRNWNTKCCFNAFFEFYCKYLLWFYDISYPFLYVTFQYQKDLYENCIFFSLISIYFLHLIWVRAFSHIDIQYEWRATGICLNHLIFPYYIACCRFIFMYFTFLGTIIQWHCLWVTFDHLLILFMSIFILRSSISFLQQDLVWK